MYRFFGLVHSRVYTLLREQRGQGTVEYVGLILLIAGVLTAVVAATGTFRPQEIGRTIVGELKQAVGGVGAKK